LREWRIENGKWEMEALRELAVAGGNYGKKTSFEVKI
jgi:hypothetical protein